MLRSREDGSVSARLLHFMRPVLRELAAVYRECAAKRRCVCVCVCVCVVRVCVCDCVLVWVCVPGRGG